MDKYQIIDTALNVFHLLWVVVMLASILVFLINRRWFWIKLGLVMSATTTLSQIVWTNCPLVILQAAIWNHGHPDDPRHIRSITCDLVQEHLGVSILPWMVTASLAALFLSGLWVAFWRHSREKKRPEN